jgi:hypothetical protein
MNLLSRLTQPKRPRYDTKVIAPEQTKADPVTPIPETPVQICAACGKPGAINQLGNISCFGYITLKYVYLCNECESERVEGKQRHYTDLHRRPIAAKETLEVSALEAKKPRRTRLTRIEEAGRTPSRPLEDRVHNLATGA